MRVARNTGLVPRAKQDFTQDELRAILRYDPETGRFTRLLTTKGNGVGAFAEYAGNDGYVTVFAFGRNYLAHRLAWFYVHGTWPEHFLDHRNRRRADNWINNLRPATTKQNSANAGPRINSQSGVRGVVWRADAKKWRVMVTVDGKSHHIGYFADLADAAQAYADAAMRLHGEFARPDIRKD